jgi:hypothetical protein
VRQIASDHLSLNSPPFGMLLGTLLLASLLALFLKILAVSLKLAPILGNLLSLGCDLFFPVP